MNHSMTPSISTASRLREIMVARGDRYVASALGVSRFTACRVAARLPVMRAVVVAVDAQIDDLERVTTIA